MKLSSKELSNKIKIPLTNVKQWITVHPNGADSKGQPIPVMEGQTKGDAVKSFISSHESQKNKTAQKTLEKMKEMSRPVLNDDAYKALKKVGIAQEQIIRLEQTLDSLPEKAKEKFKKALEKGIEVSNDSTAYYDTTTDKIYMLSEDSAEAIIHELSHSIDVGAVNHKMMYSTVTSASNLLGWYMDDQKKKPSDYDYTNVDYLNIVNYLGVKLDKDGYISQDAKDKSIDIFIDFVKKQKGEIGEEGIRRISDILSSITYNRLGEVAYCAGHENSYWGRSYTGDIGSWAEQEQWADYCALKITKNEKALNLLKEICPITSECLEKVYKEAFE